jgi:hypothetical protein
MINRTECHMTLQGHMLRGELLRYPGGQLGVQFFDENGPYGHPTINIPEKKIRPDQCWVRTYAEHTGFLDAMITAKVIKETPFFTATGEILCNVLVPLPDIDPADARSLLLGPHHLWSQHRLGS